MGYRGQYLRMFKMGDFVVYDFMSRWVIGGNIQFDFILSICFFISNINSLKMSAIISDEYVQLNPPFNSYYFNKSDRKLYRKSKHNMKEMNSFTKSNGNNIVYKYYIVSNQKLQRRVHFDESNNAIFHDIPSKQTIYKNNVIKPKTEQQQQQQQQQAKPPAMQQKTIDELNIDEVIELFKHSTINEKTAEQLLKRIEQEKPEYFTDDEVNDDRRFYKNIYNFIKAVEQSMK